MRRIRQQCRMCFASTLRLLAALCLGGLLVGPPLLNKTIAAGRTNLTDAPVSSLNPAQLGCANQAFFNDELFISYGYSICNVPDFDQRRGAHLGTPFLFGLPNDGKLYCVPTSAMNWMAYIANHGYPAVRPGPGNWQLGPPDYPDPYNAITLALIDMGIAMGTDWYNGTGGGGAETGLQEWLDQYAAGQFAVSHYVANGNSAPTFTDMVTSAIDGNLLMVGVGWYTNKDTNLPHIRKGGHVVSLVKADRFGGGIPEIGIHDPNNDAYLTNQSAFVTNSYFVADDAGTFGYEDKDGNPHTFERVQSRMVGYGSGYIDEYFAIKPKFGLTADANFLHLVKPIHLLDSLGPEVESFRPATGGKVIDLAVHPELPRHPYLVEGSNHIWQLDTLTGRSSELASLRDPKRLVFAGPQQNLYVLTATSLVCLSRDGVEQKRVRVPGCDAFGFDENRQRLICALLSQDELISYGLDLDPLGSAALPKVECPRGGVGRPGGRVSMSINPTDGTIWLHCDGSDKLTRLRFNDRGGLEGTTVRLESAGALKALYVDERGHLFLTEDGVVAEFDEHGLRVVGSPFNGLPGGDVLQMLRAFSNFDPKTMSGPAFYHVLPDDAIP